MGFSVVTDTEVKLWSSSPANQTGWTSLKTWLLKTDISSLLTKSHFCRTFFRALLKSSLKQNFGKMMAEAVGWEKNERQEEKVVSLSRPFTQQFQCFLAEITIILSFPLLPLCRQELNLQPTQLGLACCLTVMTS